MSYLGILGSNFKKLLSYIWNQCHRIRLIVKFGGKIEIFHFGTKNIWFGYFLARTLGWRLMYSLKIYSLIIITPKDVEKPEANNGLRSMGLIDLQSGTNSGACLGVTKLGFHWQVPLFKCNMLFCTKDVVGIANTICNHGHNILRLFDVWPNFPSTITETKRDY